jgi:hypothetical protein
MNRHFKKWPQSIEEAAGRKLSLSASSLSEDFYRIPSKPQSFFIRQFKSICTTRPSGQSDGLS